MPSYFTHRQNDLYCKMQDQFDFPSNLSSSPIMAQSIGNLRKQLLLILEDSSNELTPLGREVFRELYQHVVEAEQKIAHADARIEKVSQQNEVCKRLLKVLGIDH